MKKTGIIQSLNVSPKGFHEGLLLSSGKTIVQINLSKEEAGSLEAHLQPGTQITVEIEAEEPHGEPKHRVFRLLRLLSIDGEPFEANAPGPRSFSGRIERLNYALHAEVNGGILDSGDFLHLKPHGARAVKLKAGMQVEGRGSTKPMVGGRSVIEADEVNGIVLADKAKKHHAAKHAKR